MNTEQTVPTNSQTMPLVDDRLQGLESRVAELEKENAKLRQQVIDTNVELEATTYEYERVYLEIQSAKKDVERANAVKSAFLASMSHELRTPLNAIINFTRFVAKGSVGTVNDEQRDMLNDVIGSAKHLLNLINDVLDMSKIESGSLSLFVTDDVDVKSIVDQVTATGRSLLVDKPVELSANCGSELPRIRGDKQRITQVLLNIVSNACKFTESGTVTLSASRQEDNVVFSVIDTGPGIAPDDQDAVFEPFKQTKTGLRQGGGTGLGMPISKNLVEIHGGNLWLESEPGKGASFFVSLPIKSSKLQPTL